MFDRIKYAQKKEILRNFQYKKAHADLIRRFRNCRVSSYLTDSDSIMVRAPASGAGGLQAPKIIDNASVALLKSVSIDIGQTCIRNNIHM